MDVTLAQQAVDDKTNEITAVETLLGQLVLECRVPPLYSPTGLGTHPHWYCLGKLNDLGHDDKNRVGVYVMRVCFFSHSSGRGGAEEVLLETIECLKEYRIDCRVFMPGDEGLGEDLRKLSVPFYTLPYWRWMRLGSESVWEKIEATTRNVLLSLPAIVQLRKWKPDIVYSNTMTICTGAIVAQLLHRPHVWHLHELGYEDHGLTFDFGPRFSYKVINVLSTACIAASQCIADHFVRYVEPSKLTVIYPSVHRNSQRVEIATRQIKSEAVPPRTQRLRCIIVGKLSGGKRQEDAVAAMAMLQHMGIDVELLIVGGSNPGYRERLEAMVKKHNLQDRVLCTGFRDPLPFVQSADIVLMCSTCEAFGRVTVEGLLAGKPVLAANSGASPELIQDGFNGLLYKMGDTEELAQKIRYLYEHPGIARHMGQNAKSRAEAFFTKERYARQIVSLLSSVVDHGRN